MQVSKLVVDALQPEVHGALHHEGATHEGDHGFRGPVAVRLRRGYGLRLRISVIDFVMRTCQEVFDPF